MSTVEFDAPECIAEEAQQVPEMLPEEVQQESKAEEVAQPEGETESPTESSGDDMDNCVAHPLALACCEVQEPTIKITSSDGRELISDGVYEWEHACNRLQEEISDLTIERLNLSERQKSIKKRIDCMAEELEDLRKNGPQAIYRTNAIGAESDDSDSQGSDTVANDAAVASQTPTQPAQPDAWRVAPLADLNLKKNVFEKLIESGVETIGQLEDLRAAISLNKKEWPKGIGKAKITEIEDAVISWLTKHRDAGVFGQTSEVASTPEVQIQNRAKEIHTGNDGSLESKHPEGQQWHESGWNAYGRQVKLEECPYIPGPEQDDWIRGWLARDVVEKYEKATNQEEATEVADQEIVDVEPGEQPALPGNANAPTLIDQAVSLADL